MKKSILFFKLFFILLSFNTSAQQTTKETNPGTQFPQTAGDAKLSYKIINTANTTYCYDIYNNGKLMIHQPSIPGVQGNEGFKTKASAEKVAQLIIIKIKKGEMPPSVTVEELKKLKAIP